MTVRHTPDPLGPGARRSAPPASATMSARTPAPSAPPASATTSARTPAPSASQAPATVPGRPSWLRIWLLAIRPATLPAAAASVVVGLGAGLAVGAPLRVDTAAGCLAVALLLQVLANLANDLSDHRRGADTPDRAGPTRVAASGLVTERELEVAIALVIVGAGVIGLWLVVVGGPVLLGLGALAIVAALAYTGGPFPYGYRALGDLFVFVFFGIVAVVGTAYLQALRLDPLFVVAAIPPGALITAILVVNNLRDIPTDTAAGKRTLAVILGRRGTAVEYALLVGIAYAIPALLAGAWLVAGGPLGAPRPLTLLVLLPLLTVPAARSLLGQVRGFREPRELNRALKGTARLALWHALLFAAGLAANGIPVGGAAR